LFESEQISIAAKSAGCARNSAGDEMEKHTLAVICVGTAMRPTFPYAPGDEPGMEYDEEGTGNFIFEFDLAATDTNAAQEQMLNEDKDVVYYTMLD
jgi:hypothetical protein